MYREFNMNVINNKLAINLYLEYTKKLVKIMEIGVIEKIKKLLSPENKEMEIEIIKYRRINIPHLLDTNNKKK